MSEWFKARCTVIPTASDKAGHQTLPPLAVKPLQQAVLGSSAIKNKQDNQNQQKQPQKGSSAGVQHLEHDLDILEVADKIGGSVNIAPRRRTFLVYFS